jgi:hypothetical protein
VAIQAVLIAALNYHPGYPERRDTSTLLIATVLLALSDVTTTLAHGRKYVPEAVALC